MFISDELITFVEVDGRQKQNKQDLPVSSHWIFFSVSFFNDTPHVSAGPKSFIRFIRK